MVNNFSPLLAILRGQHIEQGLAQAGQEGFTNERAILDQLAAREAGAGMGATNDFAGYEGIPGAQRPDYLKKLYASGSPDDAMKMETMLASPFANQRAIATAGAIEKAKKTADYEVFSKAIADYFGDSMGGGGGASTDAAPQGEAPSIPAVGEPQAPTAVPNLQKLPAVKRTAEISMAGPKFGMEKMSDLERGVKIDERRVAGGTLELADKKEKREALDKAHENVRQTTKAIIDTQKAMQNRDIPWEEGRAQIGQLNEELQAHTQHRDALVSGRFPQQAPAPVQVTPLRPPAGAMASSPRFTQKEQGGLDVKDQEEKLTTANKEIANARLGAEKVLKFRRQVGELYDIVTKQDIGHPTLDGIPLAGNIMSMNRSNAQVKKLNEAIINMFAEPGQSQMMNTIVERQMQGAVVPSLFTDPQLNKINAAVLRSNVEHLTNFPTFLEKWQKSHGSTLDGAADAWIDYTENNPLYTYSKDLRGRVKVQENSHIVPLNRWMDLRATGGVRKVGGKMFIKQDDGSWMEK